MIEQTNSGSNKTHAANLKGENQSLEKILEDMAESYYPEHEYNDAWRDRNTELRQEAAGKIQTLIAHECAKARLSELEALDDYWANHATSDDEVADKMSQRIAELRGQKPNENR